MKLSEWARKEGITYRTAFLWFKNNKLPIPAKQLETGSIFVYPEESKERIDSKYVIYVRVSTQKQRKDLKNQLDSLRNFAINSGIQIKQEISDIESSMTIDRKGLNELINQVINYEVDKVIISYKDRLARLNFKTLEELFKNFGTEIIIANNSENSQTLEQELLNEIISIIHTFSMKVYSQRKKKKLELVKKDLELEDAINL